ncbi:MAG: hypothetical protein ACREUV_01815 [Burkholderiales bacterium]
MTKFGFRIRTRGGLTVDNLVIHGRDQADAERKLKQMYLHCEILEAHAILAKEQPAVAFEDVVTLIASQNKRQ